MKKKGFTLIELLAVIVILAIIALIAVPTILGVIEKAKRGAQEASALSYIDAVEKYMVLSELDNAKYPVKLEAGKTYSVSSSSVAYIDKSLIKKVYAEATPEEGIYLNSFIEVKGDKPDSGTIEIGEKNTVKSANLVIGEYDVICETADKCKATKNGDEKTISVESISINNIDNNTIKIGETLKLNATVLPNNATNKTVTWTSSDKNVATVNSEGLVTGVGEGSVTITSKIGSKTDSIEITIYRGVLISQIEKDVILSTTENTEVRDEKGKYFFIPANYKLLNVSTKISDGIVIADSSNNEFVWIPVNDYNEFVLDTDFKESGYSDNVEDVTYINMLKSVEKYKGFYIGRYEAGSSEVSKRNVASATDSFQSAKTKASSYGNNSYITGLLMFGVQYDGVLRFIKNNDSTKDLNDSSAWGNYRGTPKILTGLVCQSYGSNTWVNKTNFSADYYLYASGIIEENKALNIYDLAGNQSEWTQENNGVQRGGGHQVNITTKIGAASRYQDSRYGFRYSFFIN